MQPLPKTHRRGRGAQKTSCNSAEELKRHRAIVLAAVEQDGLALQFAAEELKGDGAIVLAAVQRHGCALDFAAEELKRDHAI
eukprot:3756702-Amphidinium_carterae.1